MYFTLVDNDIIHLFTDLLTRLIPVNITYYIFFICNIYYILHITKFIVYTYDWRWFFSDVRGITRVWACNCPNIGKLSENLSRILIRIINDINFRKVERLL